MKTLTIAALFIFGTCLDAIAQGTIYFTTRPGNGRDAPATFPNGAPVGAGYVAGLYLQQNEKLSLLRLAQ